MFGNAKVKTRRKWLFDMNRLQPRANVNYMHSDKDRTAPGTTILVYTCLKRIPGDHGCGSTARKHYRCTKTVLGTGFSTNTVKRLLDVTEEVTAIGVGTIQLGA